jgi:hypothetical protein
LGSFFRKGGVGGFEHSLSDDIGYRHSLAVLLLYREGKLKKKKKGGGGDKEKKSCTKGMWGGEEDERRGSYYLLHFLLKRGLPRMAVHQEIKEREGRGTEEKPSKSKKSLFKCVQIRAGGMSPFFGSLLDYSFSLSLSPSSSTPCSSLL